MKAHPAPGRMNVTPRRMVKRRVQTGRPSLSSFRAQRNEIASNHPVPSPAGRGFDFANPPPERPPVPTISRLCASRAAREPAVVPDRSIIPLSRRTGRRARPCESAAAGTKERDVRPHHGPTVRRPGQPSAPGPVSQGPARPWRGFNRLPANSRAYRTLRRTLRAERRLRRNGNQLSSPGEDPALRLASHPVEKTDGADARPALRAPLTGSRHSGGKQVPGQSVRTRDRK